MGGADDKVISSGYGGLLAELKNRIHDARMRAALAANQELTLLYWDIGQMILARQDQEGWGPRSSTGCRRTSARPSLT